MVDRERNFIGLYIEQPLGNGYLKTSTRAQLVGRFPYRIQNKRTKQLVVKRTVNGWSEVTKKYIYFCSVVLQVNNYNPNIFRNAMNVARSRILGSSENQAILGKP